DQGASGDRERGIGAALLPDCRGHRSSLYSPIQNHRYSRRGALRIGRTCLSIQRSPAEFSEDPVNSEILDINGYTKIEDALRVSPCAQELGDPGRNRRRYVSASPKRGAAG